MKKTKRVTLIVLGALLLLFIGVKFIVRSVMEHVRNISVDISNLSYVSDVTYIGKC